MRKSKCEYRYQNPVHKSRKFLDLSKNKQSRKRISQIYKKTSSYMVDLKKTVTKTKSKKKKEGLRRRQTGRRKKREDEGRQTG